METVDGVQFDVLSLDCPSRPVLQRIGSKWTMLVFMALKDGSRRFSAIRATVQGVTPKVLTETLRALERDGLVSRQIYAEVPPRVEYSLTELGVSLLSPLEVIRQWAEQNAASIIQARDNFDANADDAV